MEKISNIVRGSARTASVDLKSSSAVRPGVPSFGRPVGESPQVVDRGETTAARAAALQTEMNETKKNNAKDHVVEQMADAFFMTRMRRPEDEVTAVSTPASKAKVSAKVMDVDDEVEASEVRESEIPVGFTPRGSYVDVHA